VRKLSIFCPNDIQVVPTEYKYLSKKVLPTNQFSVTEYFLPIRPTDRAWPGNYPPSIPCQAWHLHLFSKLNCFFFSSCSGLLPVWSVTNYSHHQRGKKELPSFCNSSMCSSWWHICHDRLACTQRFFSRSVFAHFAFFSDPIPLTASVALHARWYWQQNLEN
jgi:hypothetical protein